MRYIKRDMEALVVQTANEYPAILVTGPRQVGKTTMLEHIIEQHDLPHEKVTLDDLSSRSLAKNDPAMFFQLHRPPVLIDEVQYAPELFVEMKKMIDAGAEPGLFLADRLAAVQAYGAVWRIVGGAYRGPAAFVALST